MTFDDAMDAVRRAHEDALLTAENQARETIRSRAEAFEKALAARDAPAAVEGEKKVPPPPPPLKPKK